MPQQIHSKHLLATAGVCSMSTAQITYLVDESCIEFLWLPLEGQLKLLENLENWKDLELIAVWKSGQVQSLCSCKS